MKKYIPSIVLFAALMVCAFLAWAVVHQEKVRRPKEERKTKKRNIVLNSPEPALIKEFIEVAAQLKALNVTYAGRVTTTAVKGITKKARTEHFVFSRSAGDCYYQIGETEIVNQGRYCLMVDHQQKKVMLTPKKAMQAPGLPDPAQFESLIQADHYAVKSGTVGKDRIISFVNESHGTCREYSIQFDRQTHKIVSLYLRVPDRLDPYNLQAEQRVEIFLDQNEENASLKKYLLLDQVIKQRPDQLVLSARFKNYELTTF